MFCWSGLWVPLSYFLCCPRFSGLMWCYVWSNAKEWCWEINSELKNELQEWSPCSFTTEGIEQSQFPSRSQLIFSNYGVIFWALCWCLQLKTGYWTWEACRCTLVSEGLCWWVEVQQQSLHLSLLCSWVQHVSPSWSFPLADISRIHCVFII